MNYQSHNFHFKDWIFFVYLCYQVVMILMIYWHSLTIYKFDLIPCRMALHWAQQSFQEGIFLKPQEDLVQTLQRNRPMECSTGWNSRERRSKTLLSFFFTLKHTKDAWCSFGWPSKRGTYFRGRVAEFPGVAPGLEIHALPSAVAWGGWGGRGGAEELLEDGHDQEHGDEDGGGHQAKGHRVDGVVLELAPAAAALARRRQRVGVVLRVAVVVVRSSDRRPLMTGQAQASRSRHRRLQGIADVSGSPWRDREREGETALRLVSLDSVTMQRVGLRSKYLSFSSFSHTEEREREVRERALEFGELVLFFRALLWERVYIEHSKNFKKISLRLDVYSRDNGINNL